MEKIDKKKYIFIVLIFFLISGFSLFVGIKIGNNNENNNSNNNGVNLNIDKNSKDEIKDQGITKTSKGVSIPGWASITLPVNSLKATVNFYNPEANKDLYFLSFKLSIYDKSGNLDVIYESDLVEPSKHIYDITLLKKLNKGEYDGVIHVQPYRIKDKSETNAADLKTKIIVK